MLDNGDRSINILLAGQTGVGRSTLINMITGAADGSEWAARVSNDVRPCPIETTVRTAPLEVDGEMFHCSFWDTRGLDEAVDHPNFMNMAVNWFRQQGLWLSPKHQSERDLRNICREHVNDRKDGDPTRSASTVILMWCIHASKIDVPIHWKHFRKVYVEYCSKRVKPVVVITQMTPGFAKEWEKRCRDQLKVLRLGIRRDDTDDVLLVVRRHRNASSPEYMEDSLSLKRLISRLSAFVPTGMNEEGLHDTAISSSNVTMYDIHSGV